MSFSFSLNLLKFEDVRNQIVEYLKENSEFSAQFDFTASNISLIIDSMAYVSMLMSYQLSNVANNLFLDTTIIRKNAISIAKTMGYRPKRVYSSKVFGDIQYEDTTQVFPDDAFIKIPAQSVFISDTGYQFINFDDVYLTKSKDNSSMLTGAIVLSEGIVKTYSYLGNGQPFQKFTIPSKKVEENNFSLYVRPNTDTTGRKWEEVKQSFNLLDKYSYFIEEDIETEGYINVLFGDGDITYYPESSDIVDIYYLESNATAANGSTIVSIPDTTLASFVVSGVSSYNTSNFLSVNDTTGISYGGKDLETIAEIQANAPKSFAAVGRAVTQNDYKTLLGQYPYIYKSNAIGGDTLYPENVDKLGNIYISCIPLVTDIFNLYDNDILYLTTTEELALRYEIDKYRIISTQLNFLKPSYTEVVLTPRVETRSNLNAYETEQLKTNVKSTLEDFVKANYNDYNISFRTSRFNGEINQVQNVLSSEIDCSYSFALTNESFYNPSENDNSSIFLPIKIKTKNSFGIVTAYESFVQTNQEKMDIMGVTSLPITDRTIYGTIHGDTVTRSLYNVDNLPTSGAPETCKIMIDGQNIFFTFYRFANNNSNISFTRDDVTTVFTNDTVSGDAYKVTLNGLELGTFYRTMNVSGGFKGIAESGASITSNNRGDFYQIVNEFAVSGIAEPVVDGDYIIHDGTNWKKALLQGEISAVTDEGLFPRISQNDVYEIAVDGDFGGYTTPVVSGEFIIFNLYSESNSAHKWEKINQISNPPLSADIQLPPEAVDYELKRVILDAGTTNFNGGLATPASGDSLIFYNASLTAVPEANRWQILGNVAPSAIASWFPTTVDSQPLTGCTLEAFDYTHPTTAVPIGTALRTVGIGNYGLSEQSIADKIKVNWATIEDVAYDDDILVYIGIINDSPTWNIWQEGLPQVFNIDGNVPTALPKDLQYGDMLTVSGSGDFEGGIDEIAQNGDFLVYVGANEWIINNPISALDATSASGLPVEAAIGDYFKITEDGNFENSYLISPASASFVQGDYIIFNGTDYVFLNEYTFSYNGSPDARDYLNEVGFNSTYNYNYSLSNRSYNFYFNDQFTGQQIGTFRYDSSDDSPAALFTVGKLEFEPYVTGKYNELESTGNVLVKSLFDNTINKISFQPKHKRDVYGNLSYDLEQNFDTTFNMVTTITIEDTVIEQ